MMEQASQDLKFDEIGYWSEIKLDIVKKYAAAYTTILARQECLSFSYVDGFAVFAEFQSLRRKSLCSMHLRATLRYCQPILPAESDGLSTTFKDAS